MKQVIYLIPFLLLCLWGNSQEMNIKTTDGVNLYVKVKGTGTPCLYLHGGPGSGSYWFEKFMGEAMEPNFQMIYLDQRGVGRSSSPDDKNFSMDRMIKDFEEVRKSLGIEKWVLVGHSFGGLLQMGYSQQFPKSIEGMIMINCALNMNATYTQSWCPKACEFLGIKNLNPFLDASKPLAERWDSLISLLNEKDLMWKMGYSTRENMETMNATYSEVPNWNWDFVSNFMDISDYWKDYSAFSKNMKMPVLFFYGTKDWMIGPKHFKSAKFPNMMLWKSDVGHMPFLENKADLISAIKSYKQKFNL